MPKYIDTHSHLYDSAYGDACADAVRRAIECGVTRMVCPDTDETVREKMFSLASQFPENVFPCLGLHPTELGEDWKGQLDAVVHFSGPEVCAIGEIGMDFHWDGYDASVQEEVFRTQLDLALQMDLPVIIHNREATGSIIRILSDYRGRGLRGVFHAFTGSYETFAEIRRYGEWFVGIGGVLTFRNASIAETVKSIPIESILLETDSPYLTPAPYRGLRNESALIPVIAQKLADLRGMPLEKVASVTSSNAEKLFGI
ncbi:MAG: TatD family hydrolase [Candidatus Cryptobacteroides sp.]